MMGVGGRWRGEGVDWQGKVWAWVVVAVFGVCCLFRYLLGLVRISSFCLLGPEKAGILRRGL